MSTVTGGKQWASTCNGVREGVRVRADAKPLFHPHADDPDKEPSWIESVLIGKGSNLALAIVCR